MVSIIINPSAHITNIGQSSSGREHLYKKEVKHQCNVNSVFETDKISLLAIACFLLSQISSRYEAGDTFGCHPSTEKFSLQIY